jgi:tetratricopeptide (TPR) repeat protein/CHAT domain-containing protein
MMTQNPADALAMFRLHWPLNVEISDLLDGLREGSGVLRGARWIERDRQRYLSVTGDAPLAELEQLNGYTVALTDQGNFGGALMFSSLALRLSLAWLPDNHPVSLLSLTNVAGSLDRLGNSRAALPLFERAVAMCGVVYGEDAPNTLIALNDRANCHQRLGDIPRALATHEHVLSVQRVALGEDHVHTLISMNNVARCHVELGEPEKALPLYEVALEKLSRTLGSEHALTLRSLNGIARCHTYMGHMDRALPFHEQAFAIRRAALGEDHPDTLTSMSNLAQCLDALGESSRALALFEQALPKSVAALGEQHPETLSARHELAHFHERCGEPHKAQSLFEQVLEQRRTVLGENHPQTIDSLARLANCYDNQGNSRRALPLHEQVLSKRREQLGDEHPDTLTALNTLATCHAKLGDARHALPMFEQSLARYRARWGDDHPVTLSMITNLAGCYSELGQPRDALPLVQEVLKQRRALLGEGHPETLESIGELAHCHESLGHYREASNLYEQVVTSSQATLGKTHPDTLRRLSGLATCYFREGQIAEALRLAERSLELRRATLGDDHFDTLSSAGNLASFCIGAGEFHRARRLLERTVEKLRALCGEEHPVTLVGRSNLANCYAHMGEALRARPLFEQVLESQIAVVGASHAQTQSTLNGLANCCLHLGDARYAMSLFERAVEQQRETLGNEHYETQLSLHNLALCYVALEDERSAVPILQEVLTHYRVLLGEDHPSTLMCLRNLAYCHNRLGENEQAKSLFELALAKASATLGEYHPTTLTCLSGLPQVSTDMNDVEGLRAYGLRFIRVVATTRLRDRFWSQYAVDAVSVAASVKPEADAAEWVAQLRRISQSLLEELDLAEADTKARLGAPFQVFHAEWLRLAVVYWPAEVPAVLAAIQGHDMAALLLDELLSDTADFPEGDSRREYLEVRQELRRLRLQLNSQTSDSMRWQEVMTAHEQAHAKYLHCRDALADAFPEFRLAGSHLDAETSRLTREISADAAIVLLFTMRTARDSKYKVCIACVLRHGSAIAYHLPLMPEALQALQGYEFTLEGRSRGVLRRLRADVPESPAHEPVSQTLPALCEIFREALWSPLEEALTGVRTLHVIVQDVFHNLPLAASVAEDKELFIYPGLLFYLQRHHLPDPSPSRPSVPQPDATWMALHIDAAAGTSSHIPFVAVDAALVRSIVGGQRVYAPPPGNTSELWEDPQARSYPAWYFATHGGVHAGPPRQTFLYLDMANQRTLDTSRVVASAQRPRVVVLGCCLVARVHEDKDGNPLGLLSAFFLRGADYIVAAIQSVHDFYMPLLVGVFHQAWLELRDPHPALSEAKRRLRSGEWYEDTATHLHAAYLPVLREVLEAANAHTISGWLLPRDVRDRYPGAFDVQRNEDSWREFEREHCRTPEARDQLALDVVTNLVEQRSALPADCIEHLCAWVCGFGCVRKT